MTHVRYRTMKSWLAHMDRVSRGKKRTGIHRRVLLARAQRFLGVLPSRSNPERHRWGKKPTRLYFHDEHLYPCEGTPLGRAEWFNRSNR